MKTRSVFAVAILTGFFGYVGVLQACETGEKRCMGGDLMRCSCSGSSCKWETLVSSYYGCKRGDLNIKYRPYETAYYGDGSDLALD